MYSRIKAVRKDSGLSQKEFADRLHLSRNFIALAETNVRNISQRTINDICREFNVNETWLRTGEGNMHDPITSEQSIAQVVGVLTVKSDVVKSAMITALSKMDEQDLRKLLTLILNALTDQGVDVTDFLK